MIAYKGFNKGLVCRGYQFQPGENITEEANCAFTAQKTRLTVSPITVISRTPFTVSLR